MLLQDQIVVTKPVNVKIGVDRITDEVKRAEIVNELVAQWWVPEGADLVLEPWIEQGIRFQGWRLTRKAGVHVVPDVDGDVVGVDWHKVAQEMVDKVRVGEVTDALVAYELASMQQAMVNEPEEHHHQWPEDLTDDSMCQFPGCRTRWEDV